MPEEIKNVLDTINSGRWLQLEGSIGRHCNSFIESGIIIPDEKETKEKGPICFTDGYGRPQKQVRFKIDWDKFDEIEEKENA
jgi:hypothetical protein